MPTRSQGMANDRLFKYASKTVTGWTSKPLPGWWQLAQIVGAVFLIGMLAISIITGKSTSHHGTPRVIASDPTVSAEPTSTASPAPTSSSQPPAGATTPVATAAGGTVQVPTAAVTAATLKFRSVYDPALASKVPVVAGSVVAAGPVAFPGYTVSALTLSSGTVAGGTLTFTAVADADGKRTRYSSTPVSASVRLVEGRWLFDPQA